MQVKQTLKPVFLLMLAAILTIGLCTVSLASGHGEKLTPKKAILLVTFGTSVPEAQKSFALIEDAYKKAFPKMEIRWAYTAKIIRDKLAKEGKTLLSPAQAMARLMDENFTQVAVQSLHVIPGAEFHDLLKVVNGFKGMKYGFTPMVGRPLCSTTDDLKKVAGALLANQPKGCKKGEAVIYMGHGTHHPAGVAYPAMAYLLSLGDSLSFMGTVEGYPVLDDLIPALKKKGVNKAYLVPFMTVAGDHAMNDMAGDEDDSWKSILTKKGIKAVPVMKPITMTPGVIDIWIEHTKAVMAHFK